MPHQVSRRTVSRGVAWSAPVIVLTAAAPALAASPLTCRTTTMDWGAATTTKLANPRDFTITGTQTVYPRVSYVETAPQLTETSTRQLRIDKNGWGSALGPYTINTTAGLNDLVLSQQSGSGSTAVTITFYSDAARTRLVNVNNLQVPLDDFSSARSFSGGVLVPSKSHEEAWSVTGTELRWGRRRRDGDRPAEPLREPQLDAGQGLRRGHRRQSLVLLLAVPDELDQQRSGWQPHH